MGDYFTYPMCQHVLLKETHFCVLPLQIHELNSLLLVKVKNTNWRDSAMPVKEFLRY